MAKDDACEEYSVEFQGREFKGCVDLSHWIIWGEYDIDIRELRKLLGLRQEVADEYLDIDKSKFAKRIKDITDAVGKEDFLQLCSRLDSNRFFKR